jgi:hypothetical protein
LKNHFTHCTSKGATSHGQHHLRIAADCNDTDIEGTSSTLSPDRAELPARRASTEQPSGLVSPP